MFKSLLLDHIKLFEGLDCLEKEVMQAASICDKTLKSGGKIIFCGNGGSAMDCQHIAAELTGRFEKDRIPLAALSLTADNCALTCISNDYKYDFVFSRQLYALGKKEDILIGLSTSGQSPNVLEAFKAAKDLKISTIALTGKSGGDLAKMADLAIIVPSNSTARIQEVHIFIGHVICKYIEGNIK